ncbi:MAG: P-II family nitrogen regulator [Eubacteriales bacterium]|nr:P-II family nitrogen regulator [Eubacteriales bacterium]
MNCVISIIKTDMLEELSQICKKLELPVTLVAHGRGTATKNMLNLLGIESREKRIVINVAAEEETAALIKEEKRRLYLGIPGNGIVVAVPIKSVGGGKALSYLSAGDVTKKMPEMDYRYELLMVIANEGYTDEVMDAARASGATGGTVIHTKGTGNSNGEKFFQVSIAREKELILIVAEAEKKAAVMRSVLEKAGPESAAGALVFSLPVTEVAGLVFEG